MSLDEARSEEYFEDEFEKLVKYREMTFNPVYEYDYEKDLSGACKWPH